MSEVLSSEILNKLFELSDSDERILARAEDETVEYKQSFSFGDKLMITIAGFANNRGGFIIHGVEDGTRKLLGLTDTKVRNFKRFDLAEATQRLTDRFAPNITIQMLVHEFAELKLGVTYVSESKEKPVVAKSNGRDIREGDIYYSYGAMRTRIKYAELRNIFDEVVRRKVAQLFEHVDLISKIGVENAAIMDSIDGSVFGPSVKSFVISEDILDQLKFVKEGEFTETEGAPALKLVGNLQTYDSDSRVEVPTRISEEGIYSAFLKQESVTSPLEYIEACCDQLSPYFPIYYYARQAGLDRSSLRKKVEQVTDARSHTKNEILKRIDGETRLQERHSETKTNAHQFRNKYRQDLITENDITVDFGLSAYLISAIRTLTYDEIKTSHVLKILLNLFENRVLLKDIQFSNLRKAICHIDFAINQFDE